MDHLGKYGIYCLPCKGSFTEDFGTEYITEYVMFMFCFDYIQYLFGWVRSKKSKMYKTNTFLLEIYNY